jgi:hypothetical protein
VTYGDVDVEDTETGATSGEMTGTDAAAGKTGDEESETVGIGAERKGNRDKTDERTSAEISGSDGGKRTGGTGSIETTGESEEITASGKALATVEPSGGDKGREGTKSSDSTGAARGRAP